MSLLPHFVCTTEKIFSQGQNVASSSFQHWCAIESIPQSACIPRLTGALKSAPQYYHISIRTVLPPTIWQCRVFLQQTDPQRRVLQCSSQPPFPNPKSEPKRQLRRRRFLPFLPTSTTATATAASAASTATAATATAASTASGASASGVERDLALKQRARRLQRHLPASAPPLLASVSSST